MSFPPTIKQLKYLVALHKTLHFGKAADACHVTQSTLSAGLQELEALLGVQLVERTKRNVMFTNLGEEIVERAQTILNSVDDLMAAAEAAKDPGKGTVRMGVIPTVAPFLLPTIMPTIKTKLPNLKLNLREEKSAELCERLRTGELDVILYALPFACGEVTEMPLFEDKFFAAYPKGREPGDTITTNDLSKARLMLLEEGHCLRDHALEACHLVGMGTKEALSGTSLHTLLEMVATDQGVTLLPEMALKAGLAEGRPVSIIPFKDFSPTRTIGMIWRPSNPRAATFEKLGKVIQETWENS